MLRGRYSELLINFFWGLLIGPLEFAHMEDENDYWRIGKTMFLMLVLVLIVVVFSRDLYLIFCDLAYQIWWSGVVTSNWGQVALDSIVLIIKGILAFWGFSFLNSYLLLQNEDDEEELKKFL